METSYHGFFVGPAASPEAVEEAARRVGLSRWTPARSGGKGWAFLAVNRHAEALARELRTWVWEVELRNDFDAAAELDETHSGRICGRRWTPRDDAFELRVDDELSEEGFIRGGVMEEVAFEYARWYAKVEVEAEAEVGPIPQPTPAPRAGPSRRRAKRPAADEHEVAAALIDHLVATGDLEVVDDRARQTLVDPLAAQLRGASPASAAARIALTLEEADEVVDLYADDATIEAFLRGD